MIKNPTIEPSILPFIDDQFPRVYRENNPKFVAFAKAYYEWMETPGGKGSATLFTRSFLDERDVDRAAIDFLVHIKQKYLVGIQLKTESDTKQLIKHAKDLYRAKGSPRAVELFFRLVYDEAISLYYPKDDLFVLSDGTWTQPNYLELSLSDTNVLLEGKAVVGTTSGAVAFVDGVIRRLVNDRLHDVAYISAIQGNFVTGETVAPADGTVSVKDSPTMIGSMNRVIFDSGGSGAGYAVGMVLDVNSPYGVRGRVRVSGTSDRSDIIQLTVNSGGYGYTGNSLLIISNTVLTVSNLVMTNNQSRSMTRLFDTMTQRIFKVPFLNATGTFNPGDSVFTYYANGAQSSASIVLASAYANATGGTMTLSPQTAGNPVANAYYSAANSFAANNDAGNPVQDLSFTGSIIGSGQANVTLLVTNAVGFFVKGEKVVQHNPLWPTDGAILGEAELVRAPTGFLILDSIKGIFQPGTVIGLTTGSTATVTSISASYGLVSTNNTPTRLPGNVVKTQDFTGVVSFVSAGTTGSFGISANTLTYTEHVMLNTDTLDEVANVMLAGPYGLAGNVSANATSLMGNYLTFANTLIGSITSLYGIIPGVQIDSPPIIMIREPKTENLEVFDYTLSYSGATSAFAVGEAVTQAATNGRALIETDDGSTMTLSQLRLQAANALVPTVNSSTQIVGVVSGAVANVVSVRYDLDDDPVGLDASAQATTVTANGAVVTADVVDSGFGYVQNEVVWLGNSELGFIDGDASGTVVLGTYGTGRGFYSKKGGFLSDQKKLFDGDYYQNFSYEIQSSRTLDSYVQPLKDVVHVAGMKVFGKYVHPRLIESAAKLVGMRSRIVVGEAIGSGPASGTSSVSGAAASVTGTGSSSGQSVVSGIKT